MIEATLWHPVLQISDLQDQPVAVTLLEQEIVLWRDAQGVAHAWADRCPHRGAKFSLGRVAGDRLECGYHGWQFAPSGQCMLVPALPTFSPPATHCAQVYELQEAYGLLWVRLEKGEAVIPAFAAESDTRLRVYRKFKPPFSPWCIGSSNHLFLHARLYHRAEKRSPLRGVL